VNFPLTVAHCRSVISPKRLKGFLMAPWSSAWPAKGCTTIEQSYLKSIDLVRAAM
jgi:hypothetical protein